MKRTVGLLPTPVDTLVQQIAAENEVHEQHTGLSGEESAQWLRFEQLAGGADNEQLQALTHHANAAVRSYAFRALARRRVSGLFSRVRAQAADTQAVCWSSGCMKMTMSAGHLLPLLLESEHYPLTAGQRASLSR